MLKPYRWLFAFLILLNINNAFAQGQDELVAALNQQLIPLKTLSPDADFADLEKLKVILKDKQVIGIGEATHGTHEFFVFKHRMLQFLVKEMGVKTFVIEGDFAGTQTLDDYVINGKGNVQDAIAGTGFGIWMTGEFVDMVNWLKQYNATQPAENKVHVFGIDMQWGTFAVQSLKVYLEKTNQLKPQMEPGFEALKKYMPALSNTEKTALRTSVSSLSAIQFTGLDTNQAAMYKHTVRQLQQVVEYMDGQSTFFPAKQSDIRDKMMAENCEWIYNYTSHAKMMIWAHNTHINKSDGNQGHKRMGMYLSEDLKDKYYAMGFDFSTGKVRSYDYKTRRNIPVAIEPSADGTSGALFAKCNTPNFILDLKSASANTVMAEFLNKKVPSIMLGGTAADKQRSTYITHKLAETFDAIIYIRDTGAAVNMDNGAGK